MYFWTADEHYGHHNIIKYSKRPFKKVFEMNSAMISNHNAVVSVRDTTIHCGDFMWGRKEEDYESLVSALNGKHLFIRGSHDKWINSQLYRNVNFPYLIEFKFGKIYIVATHYAMRTWPRQHYNSWNIHGHSHGRLEGIGKQYDVGVDGNNFYPVSFERLKEIMELKLDNFVRRRNE